MLALLVKFQFALPHPGRDPRRVSSGTCSARSSRPRARRTARPAPRPHLARRRASLARRAPCCRSGCRCSRRPRTPGGVGCLGLPPADATDEPHRQVLRGGQHLHRPDRRTRSTCGATRLDASATGSVLGRRHAARVRHGRRHRLTWQHGRRGAVRRGRPDRARGIARRDDMRGLLHRRRSLLAIAFFVLPTRVHERYLFPALALAAPLLLLAGARGRGSTAGSRSLLREHLLGLHRGLVVRAGHGDESRRRRPADGAERSVPDRDPPHRLRASGWSACSGPSSSSVVVLWHRVRHALAPFRMRAAPASRAVRRRRARPHGAIRAARRAPPRSRGSGWGWLATEPGRRLPARADPPARSARRAHPLALVLFALLFRLWRLDLPRSQHFDEVYHGRSATEFLSVVAGGLGPRRLRVDPSDAGEVPHRRRHRRRRSRTGRRDAVRSTRAVDRHWPSPRRASAWGWERSTSFTVEDGDHDRRARCRDRRGASRAGRPAARSPRSPTTPRRRASWSDAPTAGTVDTFEVAGSARLGPGRPRAAGRPADRDRASTAVSEIVVQPTASTGPVLVRGPGAIAVVERETDAVRATADGRYGGIGLVPGVATATCRASTPWPSPTWSAGRSCFLDATTLEAQTDAERCRAGRDRGRGARSIGPLRGARQRRATSSSSRSPASCRPPDEHPATTGGIAAVDADDAAAASGSCRCPARPRPSSATRTWRASSTSPARSRRHGRRSGPPSRTSSRAATARSGSARSTPPSCPGRAAGHGLRRRDHRRRTTTTRGCVVSTAADGRLRRARRRIDAGSNAFAWRVAGIGFGAALVGLIYLLGATMFGRRRIAILAAAFVAIDGMSYVMSRIAMNDIFVAFFIVAAYLLFWQVWSGRWRAQRVVGDAARRRPHRPRRRHEVGRLLRHGRAAHPRARAVRRSGGCILVRAGGAGDRRRRHRRAVAVRRGHARHPRPGAGHHLGPAAPDRRLRGADRACRPRSSSLAGIGLPFVLAFDAIRGGTREPGSAVEYLFGLLARGAEAGWPAFIMLGVAGVLLLLARLVASLRNPALGRAMVAAGRARRLRLGLGRRVPRRSSRSPSTRSATCRISSSGTTGRSAGGPSYGW